MVGSTVLRSLKQAEKLADVSTRMFRSSSGEDYVCVTCDHHAEIGSEFGGGL